MLRNMFLLFTGLDLLAINEILTNRNEEAVQFSIMWLLFYSAVAGWALGARAWKECQGNCPAPQALLRVLACSSLFYGACAAALQFGGRNPDSWLGVYLFLLIYLLRLTPPAAATILVTPFLWVSQPRLKTLVLVAISQACCWYGGYRVTGGQEGWRDAFLQVSLWIPNWGFALMVGGLLLKPLLNNEANIAQTEPGRESGTSQQG
ncbi:MAG: hypothetical protein U0931_03885 [Vulcanimicrobiota bacterium]